MLSMLNPSSSATQFISKACCGIVGTVVLLSLALMVVNCLQKEEMSGIDVKSEEPNSPENEHPV